MAQLSWKTRISIATVLCRVLIFLHSSKPISIIHGDLTPANILLDANFVSKLSDFGICHLLPHDQSSRNTALGTFAYMDPKFLSTGVYFKVKCLFIWNHIIAVIDWKARHKNYKGCAICIRCW